MESREGGEGGKEGWGMKGEGEGGTKDGTKKPEGRIV